MSLLCDKHRPNTLNKVDYHREMADRLKKLIANGDFPHLFLFGPSGAGKKTRVNAILRELYGTGVEKLKLDYKEFQTPAGRKLQQTIVASNYHFEVNPSDAGIYDRVIIHDLIKETAACGTLTEKHTFKVVVITEADKLTREAQHALRRTMEKHAAVCRLILIGESSSRVIPAVKSRCLLLRIAAPSVKDITAILLNIAKRESISLSPDFAEKIANECHRNLRRAILMMETGNVCGGRTLPVPQWIERIKFIARKIIEAQTVNRLKEIREYLFELQTHLIPPELVMRELVKELLPNCVENDMKPKLISLAAEYEHKMRFGSKHIYHFEAFLAKFMAMYKCAVENVDFDDMTFDDS